MQHSSTTDQNGRQWLFFDQIDSTNNEAQRQIAIQGVQSGDVIYTHFQQQGKGQRGKEWVGPYGLNLAMTYVYVPDQLEVRRTFVLNQAVALACMDLLRIHGIQPHWIKWPNDVYTSGGKLGGILIQNTLTGKSIQNSIIGIGMNVNQKEFDPNLPNPTSFWKELGRELPVFELIQDLTMLIDVRIGQMEEGHFDVLHEQYMDQLFLKHANHVFEVDGVARDGVIRGVDHSGRLQVSFGDTIESFQFGQIKYGASGDNHDRG